MARKKSNHLLSAKCLVISKEAFHLLPFLPTIYAERGAEKNFTLYYCEYMTPVFFSSIKRYIDLLSH